MRKEYESINVVLPLLLFVACLLGGVFYSVNDWKPDKIVSEEFIGTVKEVQISGGSTVIVVSHKDSGLERKFLLDKGRQPESVWLVEKGEGVFLADAILNDGRSKLHHAWLAIAHQAEVKRYYLLSE